MKNAPELVMGGGGGEQLEAFWQNYKLFHPEHPIFHDADPRRTFNRCLAFSLHGDEGRGLKKGNTAVLMLETNLGLPEVDVHRKRRWADRCDDCMLEQRFAKMFKTTAGLPQGIPPTEGVERTCECQTTNMKQHSFLTKYLLAAFPNCAYKKTDLLDRIHEKISADLKDLFLNGIVCGNPPERWFVAFTGVKGDLRWVEKVARLSRCFNKQIGKNLCCCHMCMAGTTDLPWEDFSFSPGWQKTCFVQRPWEPTSPPPFVEIPFEVREGGAPERMLRTDMFHICKQGVLRDFVASAVLLFVTLGYFDLPRAPGVSNSRDACLGRAHDHFKWYCRSLGKTAGLRSFTAMFFNAVTTSMYICLGECQGIRHDPDDRMDLCALQLAFHRAS